MHGLIHRIDDRWARLSTTRESADKPVWERVPQQNDACNYFNTASYSAIARWMEMAAFTGCNTRQVHVDSLQGGGEVPGARVEPNL